VASKEVHERFNMVLDEADSAALARLKRRMRLTKSALVRQLIRDADRRTTQALVDAVRAWANSDCGATEAEAVLAALARYDSVRRA
jgi:hypothetical protein